MAHVAREVRVRARLEPGGDVHSDHSMVGRMTVPNPKAARARQHVYMAIRRGELVRPDECTFCHKKGRIEGAHWDYSRPLDVIWLCVPCHRKMDAAYPNGGNLKVDEKPQPRRRPDGAGPVHGTLTGYNWHRCRCPECREAMSTNKRAQRHRRATLVAAREQSAS